MTRRRAPARQRSIAAALELFAAQGFAETTTRQIAERAQVNEVTLFRNFGSKRGLLLAAIEDSGVFTRLGESLELSRSREPELAEAIAEYARERLHALLQMPELLRSVVGEAGHYTPENRQALVEGIDRALGALSEYLQGAIAREGVEMHLSARYLAGLLEATLLGYVAVELTTESPPLWRDREEFIANLVELYWRGTVSPRMGGESEEVASSNGRSDRPVADLPGSVVRGILQQAKKQGSRDYAIAYLLFGAGLLPSELVSLRRSQCTSTGPPVLQVENGKQRQVPVNRSIMGKRYGSDANNPLSQWLKNRKDDRAALFLNDAGQPLSETELRSLWHQLVARAAAADTPIPAIEQARHTWCVEMLMKGIAIEDLSILSGWDVSRLQPYVRRAREKAAIERAIQLDRS